MKLFLYRIRNLLSIREALISMIAIVAAVSTGIAAFTFMEKNVDIYVEGLLISVKTLGTTVGDAIKSGDIFVDSDDYISEPLGCKLSEHDITSIYIKRSKTIKIEYDGRITTVKTLRTYISDVLSDNSMTVGEQDRIEGFSLSDRVTDGMEIRIIKIEKRYETEQEEIPFEINVTNDRYADFGVVSIIEQGTKGIIEHAFEAIYENGMLVSRNKIYEIVLREPEDQYESHGMIKTYRTSTGYTIRYIKVLEVRMTAYTASLKDTGKDVGHPLFGVTYTGRYVEHGIVAVDPKFIPLNTKMYVEIDGNTPDYGFSIAADTGGAIKNDLIDLYFDTQEFVDRWGTKWGRVYILADDDPNLDLCPD